MSDQDKTALINKVESALDEIRPHLKVDGGNVEVVDITDNFEVKIKWLGNCEVCSMSEMTMKAGIAETLKGKFPQIKGIIAVNGLNVIEADVK